MMKIYAYALITMIGLTLMAGCSRSFEVIRDMRELPQDHRYYIKDADSGQDLVSAEDRERLQYHYNRCFFLPWHQEASPYSPAEVEGFFNHYGHRMGNGVPGKRQYASLFKRFLANACLDRYPNTARQAITIRHANLRGLPTARASHSLPSGPSTGPALAFDRLQVSSIPANTPVFISHLSRDRKWCLVETGFAFGWLPTRDLATVDAGFIRAWENGSYVCFIKDKYTIHGKRHNLMQAAIGSLFPKSGEDETTLEILVAVSGRKGQAVMSKARVPKTHAVSSPLPLNLHHIAALANELVDDPYGWGGKDGKRDCSSMIRDLFAPFGLWLPRHSADQASQGGHYVDLSGKGREEKKATLMSRGVPYLTLLWFKGHIMLYVGAPAGEPLVFHNFWSVRTVDILGRGRKKIVGRTAITTLHPGKEMQPPGSSQGDLLDAIQGMTLLLHPGWPHSLEKQGPL